MILKIFVEFAIRLEMKDELKTIQTMNSQYTTLFREANSSINENLKIILNHLE